MIEMCKQLILSILFIHLHVKFTAFILYEDCLNEIDCLTAHLSEYLEPIHFSKGDFAEHRRKVSRLGELGQLVFLHS